MQGTCTRGTNCPFEHPAACAPTPVAAATLMPAGATPPTQGLPPWFQHVPPSGTAAGASATQDSTPPPRWQAEQCPSTGRWLYSALILNMLCFASMASAVAPHSAAGFTVLNDVSSAQVFELPVLNDPMLAKVMPRPWRQYWQHQNKTPTQRVSAAFTAASPRVYTGQTEQCTERYMAAHSASYLWDSGANVSCTPHRSHLTNYRGTKTIKGVQDASGKIHQVVGVGECLMAVDCGSKGKQIFRIERVLAHTYVLALHCVRLVGQVGWIRIRGATYTVGATQGSGQAVRQRNDIRCVLHVGNNGWAELHRRHCGARYRAAGA